MRDYSREDLIAICERSAVPEGKWSDRDTEGAQRQMGQCWALLKAGCRFKVLTKENQADGAVCVTDERTIWVETISAGFAAFDYGGADETVTFYLPTVARLDEAAGADWY